MSADRYVERPTKEELQAARGRAIPDVIGSGLDVLFVGINPSLYSGATGHHFARPGNRFWPALHLAGYTPRLLHPSEKEELLVAGCGVTNLVNFATAAADELSDEQLRAGAEQLRRKLTRYRPRAVAFLGISAYRKAFGDAKAAVGRTDRTIGYSEVWVLPNPSGLNAHYRLDDLARLYAEVRDAAATGSE